MTSSEWDRSTNLGDMLTSVFRIEFWNKLKTIATFSRSSIIFDRKLRFFCCGCLRSISEFKPAYSRIAISAGERYASGKMSDEILLHYYRICLRFANREAEDEDFFDASDFYAPCLLLKKNILWYVARFLNTSYNIDLPNPIWLGLFQKNIPSRYDVILCSILRDIFGNPFRDVQDTKWRFADNSEAAEVIFRIWNSFSFEDIGRVRILLENEGFPDYEIIDHFNRDQMWYSFGISYPHYRGCWALNYLTRLLLKQRPDYATLMTRPVLFKNVDATFFKKNRHETDGTAST